MSLSVTVTQTFCEETDSIHVKFKNMVSLTKLFQSQGKAPKDYTKTQRFKNLKTEWETKLKHPVVQITNGDGGGTWIHKELALDAVNWMNIPKQKNRNREKEVQLKIQEQIGGEIEVIVPCGRIDNLTEHVIVEVKEARLYKSAIGQVMCYGIYYPKCWKVIALYNYKNDDKKIIENVCLALNIDVWWR